MGLVLCYHGIRDDSLGNSSAESGEVSIRNFEKHIHLLRRYFPIVPLSDNWKSMRNISITFDDGYANNIKAFEVLSQINIPSSVFISSYFSQYNKLYYWDSIKLLGSNSTEAILQKHIGSKHYLTQGRNQVEQIAYSSPEVRIRVVDDLDLQARSLLSKTQNERFRPLSEREIFDLRKFKILEVGLHTHTHGSLSGNKSNTNRKYTAEEIEKNRRFLYNLGYLEINSFAFPFGTKEDLIQSQEPERELLPQVTCSTEAFYNLKRTKLSSIPRLVVHNWDAPELLIQMMKCFRRTQLRRVNRAAFD